MVLKVVGSKPIILPPNNNALQAVSFAGFFYYPLFNPVFFRGVPAAHGINGLIGWYRVQYRLRKGFGSL